MPKVTVVIPSFNIERHIRQTLDSVLTQSHADIEVIVVDDGSSDRTVKIVRSYGDRVRLITQANRGVSVARNHGLRAARGEYVAFLDHDDFWFPDKIALQIAEFERDPELGLVCSWFKRWLPDENGLYPEPTQLRETRDGLDPQNSGWTYTELMIDSWVLTSAALIRKTALERCGGFDEQLPYSEDWDLWLRLSRSYRFAMLNQTTTLYRQSPTQGSRTFREIDYRTRLLEGARDRWGLSDPVGRTLDVGVFRRRMARYHLEFGFSCLQAGRLRLAWAAFLRSWVRHPTSPKPAIYLTASLLGWRPRW